MFFLIRCYHGILRQLGKHTAPESVYRPISEYRHYISRIGDSTTLEALLDAAEGRRGRWHFLVADWATTAQHCHHPFIKRFLLQRQRVLLEQEARTKQARAPQRPKDKIRTLRPVR